MYKNTIITFTKGYYSPLVSSDYLLESIFFKDDIVAVWKIKEKDWQPLKKYNVQILEVDNRK